MNKDNQFRSSLFHMDEGDILNMIILDEHGSVVNVVLGSSVGTEADIDITPPAPARVVALPATDITSSSFTANWQFTENCDGYYFNLATDPDMTPHILGYENLDVGNANHVHITGLTDGVTYYYQISAYNTTGEGLESNVISAVTVSDAPLIDLDGNEYTTVIIGSQEWIVENLKVTKYADGSAIPNITDNTLWAADIDGAYSWYANDIVNKAVYGALYNWYAVDNVLSLVHFHRGGANETGWRIPTVSDFITLSNYLSGDAIAGGKLKESGFSHWSDPNTGAINEVGFVAVGAGLRSIDGEFFKINEWNGLYTSDDDGEGGLAPLLKYDDTVFNTSTGFNYIFGLSVRCVRDISVGTVYVEYTDGVDTFRKGVRSHKLVIDVTLTVLGFSGIEDVDWINLKSV